MQPIITIFCAFTRPWAIEQWLEDLSKVKHDQERTHLVFILDGDYPNMLRLMKEYVKTRNYRSFTYRMNEDWHVNESRVAVRRSRIADIKEQSKELIAATDCEVVIGLEDDTVFGHIGDFEGLYLPIMQSDQVGFIEGVQIGRWGVRMVGAWELDDLTYPKRAATMLPPKDWNPFIQEITAGGFYGYATRKELYLNHDYYTGSNQPWGPDVNYGIWVRQQGYTCLIDWRLEFGHNDAGRIAYPYTYKLAKVIYNRSIATGKWNRTDQ